MLGVHLINSCSTTLAVIALSSGEAEYYARVHRGCMGLGVQSVCKDVGIERRNTINTDASAATGIAHRSGLGKVRQILVSQLWLQEHVRVGRNTFPKSKAETT